METINKVLAGGAIVLSSVLPIKNAQAQDQVQIKGNLCLEWIADGVRNQNGILEPFEEKYMKEKFKKSNTLYVCTQLSDEFGPKMMSLYHTLKGALNHKREDLLRWPPQSILSFNKEGKITGAYRVAEGMVEFDVIPNINYEERMSERYERFYERR
jgi:hypothetical protein